jgi:hypothetical protein
MVRDAKLKRAEEFTVVMAAPNVMSGVGDAVLRILRPADGIGMMRTLLTRSRVIETAVYPSWLVGQVAVEGNSEGELNACRVLDGDPTVLRYATQPMCVFYRLAGRECSHVPDFEIVRRDGSKELWEVKSAVHAQEPQVLARTRFLQQAMPDFGYSYKLVTHRELCAEPRLTTARILARYGYHPVDLHIREQVLSVFRQLNELPWGSILRGALGPSGRDAVCRLTLEGDLVLDRTMPLHDNSMFSLHRLVLGA